MVDRGEIVGLQRGDAIDIAPVLPHLCDFPDGERMVLPACAIMASEMVENTGRRAPAVHIVSGHDRSVLCMPLTVEAARSFAGELGLICDRLEAGAADAAAQVLARAAVRARAAPPPHESWHRSLVALAILAMLAWTCLIAWALRGFQ